MPSLQVTIGPVRLIFCPFFLRSLSVCFGNGGFYSHAAKTKTKLGVEAALHFVYPSVAPAAVDADHGKQGESICTVSFPRYFDCHAAEENVIRICACSSET